MNKLLGLILACSTLILAAVLNLSPWPNLKDENLKPYDHPRIPRSLSKIPRAYRYHLPFDEPSIFDQGKRNFKSMLELPLLRVPGYFDESVVSFPGDFRDTPQDLEPMRIRSFQGDRKTGKGHSNNGAEEPNEARPKDPRSKDIGAKEKRRIKVRMFGNDLIIPNGVKYLKDVPAFLVKLGEKTKEIRIQALNMQIRKLQTWKKKLIISLGRNETDYDKAKPGEQGISSFSPFVTDPSPTDSFITKETKLFPSSLHSFDDYETSTLSNKVSKSEHGVDLEEEISTNYPESTPIHGSSNADFPHRSWRKVARKNRPNITSLFDTVDPRVSQVVPSSEFHQESATTEGYVIKLLDEDPDVGEQSHEPPVEAFDEADQEQGVRTSNFEFDPDGDLYPERAMFVDNWDHQPENKPHKVTALHDFNALQANSGPLRGAGSVAS